MIVSIGVDIIEVYRIKETMERTPRFAERVFTESERTYCEGKGVAAYQSYAARFAAKEAFFKALRTGWRGTITWHDVEVVLDAYGAPNIAASGRALELQTAQGVDKVHISISHTSDHAVAQVIFERSA